MVFPDKPEATRAVEQGRAVAREMLRAIGIFGGTSVAAQFVDSYAARFRRAGLKPHSVQYRELVSAIGRESLLAMAARMLRALPRLFGGERAELLRGAAADLAGRFREEFFEFLAGALDWSPAERDEFRRDLELYVRLDGGAGGPTRPRSTPAAPQGPFVDRCALLLDPSLLTQARQTAAGYQAELEAVIDRILAEIFGGSRAQ